MKSKKHNRILWVCSFFLVLGMFFSMSSYFNAAGEELVTADLDDATWYNSDITVTLTAGDPYTEIYYTTDGTDPSTSSSHGQGVVSVNVTGSSNDKVTRVLKFYGDFSGTVSSIVTKNYTIDQIKPTNVTPSIPDNKWDKSDLSVELSSSDTTAGDSLNIYFTTDGSIPTSSSTLYSGPISITGVVDTKTVTTVKTVSIDLAGNQSEVQTLTYVVDKIGPTISTTLDDSVWYKADLSVPLVKSDLTDGDTVTMHYTLDGSDPTSASPSTSNNVSITGASNAKTVKTLKFMAIDRVGNESPIVTKVYTIDKIKPTIVSPSITNNTWDKNDFSVELSSTDTTAGDSLNIYYTIDGSTPTASGTLYAGPISIIGAADSKTVKQIKTLSIDLAGNQSAVQTFTYVVDKIAPTISTTLDDSVWYKADLSVPLVKSDLTVGDTVIMHYTLDGTDPTSVSPSTPNNVSITGAPNTKTVKTLKFMAIDRAGNESPIVTKVYTIDKIVPTCASDVDSGCYKEDQIVTLTSADFTPDGEVTKLYYNLGSTSDKSVPTVADPTTASTLYTGSINLTALPAKEKTYQLKFFTIDKAGNQSPVQTKTILVDKINPEVSIDVGSGWYNTDLSINLTESEIWTDIYYEVSETSGKEEPANPREPDGTSTQYNSPIQLSTANNTEKTIVLKYKAKDCAGNWLQTYRQIYHIDKIVPTITDIQPRGGDYKTNQTVTVQASENTANIYYSFDGNDPISKGNLYGTSIYLSQQLIPIPLKVAVVDYAGNASSVMTENYLIDPFPPIVNSTVPTNNGTDVILNPLNMPIVINFNKNILQSSAFSNIKLKDEVNNIIPIDVTIDGNKLTVSPRQNFKYATTYSLLIPSKAVKDRMDNEFVQDYTLTYKTQMQASPRIDSMNPAIDANDVPINTLITVNFNNQVTAGISFDTIELKDEHGNKVNSLVSLSNKTLVIKPSSLLQTNKLYTVTIPNDSIKDTTYGYTMNNVETFSFTTASNVVTSSFISVTSTNPLNGANGVVISPSISIQFDTSLLKGTDFSNITLKDSNGLNIAATVALENQTVTITPTASLSGNTTYNVTIPTKAITDLQGRSLIAPYSFSFITQKISAVSQPKVINSDPVNNATGVPTNKLIIVTFDQEMLSGVDFSKVRVMKGIKTARITKSVAGDKLYIYPTTALDSSSSYKVIIPKNAVQNANGDTLVTDFVLYFTTQ